MHGTLKAYAPSELDELVFLVEEIKPFGVDELVVWKFWCPFCRKHHYHHHGGGRRAPHCTSGPLVHRGYTLVTQDYLMRRGGATVKLRPNIHDPDRGGHG